MTLPAFHAPIKAAPIDVMELKSKVTTFEEVGVYVVVVPIRKGQGVVWKEFVKSKSEQTPGPAAIEVNVDATMEEMLL